MKRVLVVDDDPAVLLVCSEFLSRLGCTEIATVRTCGAARLAVQRHQYDVAILDYYLPDGTGAQLSKELAKHVRRIAIMSASFHDADQTALLIAKPVTIGKLRAVVG